MVFHTAPSAAALAGIARDGMRPSDCDICLGRAAWVDHDAGFFGSHALGVYVSRHADYTTYYQRQANVKAGDTGTVLMLEAVVGKALHFDRKQMSVRPTPGYDCHESARNLEYYLWDQDTLCQRPCGRLLPLWAIDWRADR
eukprot:CAMPEP_0113667224 /NCGR_PEP_ID=MMETSP0038_2-20120614/3316_1 /TAXON_ID=2898 /ORGANISM="Cryptomonas paramecium" /LENGTH=140 /DNA_ID=CAMNT_0000582813 /DNA_START=8 /DNA_END=427 /DNA_ORIENTATION=+ /assembly_acc=CAM_ASM_000170